MLINKVYAFNIVIPFIDTVFACTKFRLLLKPTIKFIYFTALKKIKEHILNYG